MKRKASALEESTIAHDWPQYDNSSVSTPSPESTKAPHNQWNTPAIPYLASRTRKRYRDNRPNVESIHHNTLAKLYNAQQQLHTKEIAQQRGASQVDSYLMSLDAPEQGLQVGSDIEPKQRSLDAFFGSGLVTRQPRTQQRICQYSTAVTANALTCEDCGNTAQEDAAIDGMDVDMVEDDHCCTQCRRVICDMCAVRGDRRVCLECAVPGGGS